MSTPTSDEQVRAAVQERYAAAARASLQVIEAPETSAAGSCCGPASSCCGGPAVSALGKDAITRDLYDHGAGEVSAAALEASLGCGNPTALAELTPGEDVLDLGSGGGLDVLLSARRVGPHGTAYGVDMTPEMLALARRNQTQAGIPNATFLQGTIEAVPLPDASVDVVISNCVINLSTDKDAVLGEAFRLLRPGGRVAVSDVVLLRPLPGSLAGLVALWTGCVAGALLDRDYVDRLHAVGFVDASVEVTRTYTRSDLAELAEMIDPADLPDGLDRAGAVEALEGTFASAFVRARKPT